MEKNIDHWREVDVREGICAPFLRQLGYEKDTTNDIIREEEFTLRYPKLQFGRKNKQKDIEITGRPDYILNVTGFGKWIIEAKRPSEKIDIDTIEQAISYARHPEISASYAAITNGKNFLLCDTSKNSSDCVLHEIGCCDVDVLIYQLKNILSPAAIKRDISPKNIDFGQSLGAGLRSAEKLLSGTAVYTSVDAQIDEIPKFLEADAGYMTGLEAAISDTKKALFGAQFTIAEGIISRGNDGRIFSKMKWVSPYAQIEEFMESKKLNEINYVCLDSDISENQNKPNTFSYFSKVKIVDGEQVFDIVGRDTIFFSCPAQIKLTGEAFGYVQNRNFIGEFRSQIKVIVYRSDGMVILRFFANGNIGFKC